MTMNRRQLLATSAAALALGGHLRPAQAGVKSDELVIGTHIDLSGPAAPGMPALQNATELAIQQINDAGGVHGRKIRLVVEDNGSQPQLAVRSVQKLIRQDEVFAILNPFGSGTNAATIGAATEAGTVVFAPWGASNVMHQVSGNSPLLFTTIQNYNTTIESALNWALPEWGSQRVGVIYMEGPFGDLIRAGVAPALKTAGLEVAAEASYRPGDIDFSSQVAKMKAANVDLIVTATITRETVGVMAEVKKLGWDDVKVLTAAPGRTTIVARLGGENTEGLYGTGGWYLHDENTSNAEAKAFIDAYRDTYGDAPDENAANAYSYTNWFIDSLKAAGADLTAESFVAGARATPHSDFMTYTEQSFVDNHAMPELVTVDQIVGGKWAPQTEPF